MHTVALPRAARIEPFFAEKKGESKISILYKMLDDSRCLPVSISLQVYAFGCRDLRGAIGFGRHYCPQKEGRQK